MSSAIESMRAIREDGYAVQGYFARNTNIMASLDAMFDSHDECRSWGTVINHVTDMDMPTMCNDAHCTHIHEMHSQLLNVAV